MKKFTTIKTLLVGLCAMGATSAWAGDKTVVKYSFDDAISPSLTAGNRSVLDYSYTSAITNTAFLNVYDGGNNNNGITEVALSNVDLTSEAWTLDFYWAGLVGGNKRAGATALKAGDATLFTIADAADYAGSMALTYGTDASATITCTNTDKNIRMTAKTATGYNKATGWYHFVITGNPTDGVKMTIKQGDNAIVSDGVLSADNVTPTILNLQPGSLGAIGIDELSLTYYVEGDVIQTPVANYSNVDGINRTITATCESEDATIQNSTDGETWTDGASITVSESGKVYFKAVKGSSESDVLEFDVVAGEAITLNAPVINRTSDTSVTITADQASLLLSPTATVYYEYGSESGSFTGSKTLTVEADATITAYAEAEGYTTSATSERAVALFPTDFVMVENAPAKTSGWSANTFSSETVEASGRTYAALLLDDVQWGANVYLQTEGAWGLRASGNWYINSNEEESWLLMKDLKQGDLIVVDVDFAASDMVNATYSKYSYGARHTYEVEADGDVELAFKKINASTMDYLRGVYSYTVVPSTVKLNVTAGYATYCSEYALDLSGVEAYTATIKGTQVSFVRQEGVVAPGTGLLIKAEAGEVTIPVATEGAETIADNVLIGGTTAPIGSFVLMKDGDKVGFYKTKKEFTLGANTAYIAPVAAASGEAREFIALGEATAIKAIETAEKSSEIYNLAGQRVKSAQKGLFIIGGKKVIK